MRNERITGDKMANLDTSRDPLSDFGLDDVNLLSQYNQDMNEHNYSSAVRTLDNEDCNKGMRARVFNGIKNKMLDLEVYLLNLTADKDTLYSRTEPTAEEMGDKIFWCQPIVNDDNKKAEKLLKKGRK